ncbi:MAG: hypothetical protein IT294_12985 [Deltaproteobacteria bacterium]|nr:hypothetical protein [Deltaproteobacteria bacterium]
MRTRTSFLALAMVAALAIAGCGDDNNDNDNPPTGPTRTTTTSPQPPTVTPTPIDEPTVTPTEGGVDETPTPTPTSTATEQVCEGTALTATVTSLAGSDLDTGWTGIAHDSVATREAKVTTNLDCPDGVTCTVDGSALVGTTFGSPLPLSSGGVSSCVINQFREGITGTYNCESGCAESSVKLLSKVYLVVDQNKPCPPCVGDPTPNDGVKGGTCDGGKTPGAACDVGGISDLFQNAGGAPPDAGSTSNDCEPNGSPVGNLNIDLNPLTTGTVSVDANVGCLNSTFGATCYCPGQVQPNSCINPNGVCPASGFCENNPPIGVCSGQPFRQCFLTSAPTADCEDLSPGAGTCESQLQPCFGTTISRTGECGTQQGVLASIFCIPATQAAAINTVAGLPGPGAALIPASQVRTPR